MQTCHAGTKRARRPDGSGTPTTSRHGPSARPSSRAPHAACDLTIRRDPTSRLPRAAAPAAVAVRPGTAGGAGAPAGAAAAPAAALAGARPGWHRARAGRQRLAYRLPAGGVLGPVVGAQPGAQHTVRPQPHRQAFEHMGQRLLPCRRVGQPALGPLRQRAHLVGGQAQVAHRRGQRQPRQVFGQQAREVVHRARGLGGTHRQLTALARAARAHGVVRPVQGEGGGALLARGQPGRQLQQQAARTEDQRAGVVHPVRQFPPRLEALGQRHPGVCLGRLAVGLVQRAQQRRVEAPGQAAARQAPHIAQRATADVRKRLPMWAQGTEHAQRQRVEQGGQRRAQTVFHPRAGQRQRGQRVGRPGQGRGAEFLRAGPQTFAQRRLPAEQAQAGRHFQQHGGFGDGDAGRELQRPDRQRLQRRVSGSERFFGVR